MVSSPAIVVLIPFLFLLGLGLGHARLVADSPENVINKRWGPADKSNLLLPSSRRGAGTRIVSVQANVRPRCPTWTRFPHRCQHRHRQHFHEKNRIQADELGSMWKQTRTTDAGHPGSPDPIWLSKDPDHLPLVNARRGPRFRRRMPMRRVVLFPRETHVRVAGNDRDGWRPAREAAEKEAREEGGLWKWCWGIVNRF